MTLPLPDVPVSMSTQSEVRIASHSSTSTAWQQGSTSTSQYSGTCPTDQSMTGQLYRPECRPSTVYQGFSRDKQLHPVARKSRSPSPCRANNVYIIRNSGRHPRPASLHLDISVATTPTPRRRHASDRAPSPAHSLASTTSATSRASSRPSLIIVPPKAGVLNSQRSTVQEGTISKNTKIISASQALKVHALPPSPLLKLRRSSTG